GDPVHAHFRVVNGPPSRYEVMGVPWMLDSAVSGGGCLRNLGIHCVDAFAYFTHGEEIEVLQAAIEQHSDVNIETFAAALLRSRRSCSRALPRGKRPAVALRGHGGSLDVGQRRFRWGMSSQLGDPLR